MKEDQISCLFIDIRIIKAFGRSQSNTHKLKWVLFFIVDYESYFFLLVASFFIATFPNFFAFFTYAYMDPTCFVKCSSIWFLVSPGKLTAGLSIVYSFRGSHEKIKGCVGGKPSVICRCKHFSMFCVVRPVTRGSARGRIPPSRKFLSPPGKMYWTWIKITGHSSKILGPCQKTF